MYPEKTIYKLKKDNKTHDVKLHYYDQNLSTLGVSTLQTLVKNKVKKNNNFKVFMSVGNHDLDPQYPTIDNFYDCTHKKDLSFEDYIIDNKDNEPELYKMYVANKEQTITPCYPLKYFKSITNENLLFPNNYYQTSTCTLT